MDKITITGLVFETRIGVYDWERDILQTVSIDLSLDTDTSRAGASDKLDDAIDYYGISEQIKHLLKDRHFQLIEAMANEIAKALLHNGAIESLTIIVSKPKALRNSKSVSVSITRSRRDYT
jgi:FolB domain-containing protein